MQSKRPWKALVAYASISALAALMLADELGEAKRQAAVQNSGRAKAATAAVATPAPASDGVAEALNAVAARIEKIVQTM